MLVRISQKVTRVVTNNCETALKWSCSSKYGVFCSLYSHVVTLVELLSFPSCLVDQTLDVDVIKAERGVSYEAWCQTQEKGWKSCCDLDLIYFNHGFPSLQSTPNQPFSAVLPLQAPVVAMQLLSQPCVRGYLSDFLWKLRQLSGLRCLRSWLPSPPVTVVHSLDKLFAAQLRSAPWFHD